MDTWQGYLRKTLGVRRRTLLHGPMRQITLRSLAMLSSFLTDGGSSASVSYPPESLLLILQRPSRHTTQLGHHWYDRAPQYGHTAVRTGTSSVLPYRSLLVLEQPPDQCSTSPAASDPGPVYPHDSAS